MMSTCCVVSCSTVGADDMRWSDWTAWNCGWNLSLVGSCVQHPESPVGAVVLSISQLSCMFLFSFNSVIVLFNTVQVRDIIMPIAMLWHLYYHYYCLLFIIIINVHHLINNCEKFFSALNTHFYISYVVVFRHGRWLLPSVFDLSLSFCRLLIVGRLF